MAATPQMAPMAAGAPQNPYAAIQPTTAQPYAEYVGQPTTVAHPGAAAAYQVAQGQAYGVQGYPPQAPGNGYPLPAGSPAPMPLAQGGYQQGVYQQNGYQQHSVLPLVSPLSQRERDFLPIFLSEGALGVTDLVRITGVPQSSTYVALSKLEQAGLVEKTVGQKRILTDLGYQVANSL